MSQVQELNDASFESAVNDAKAPVLVDFSATWCQPCKALAPTIDAVAKEYGGKLDVYKVDIDAAQNTAAHAIAMAEKAGEPELVEAMTARLELFRQGQPYRNR